MLGLSQTRMANLVRVVILLEQFVTTVLPLSSSRMKREFEL